LDLPMTIKRCSAERRDDGLAAPAATLVTLSQDSGSTARTVACPSVRECPLSGGIRPALSREPARSHRHDRRGRVLVVTGDVWTIPEVGRA